jgi:DNA-binding NarL/FixJ family response regulator
LVGSHRTRLLSKLGLRTGADLVRFAVENQLLD